jgi:hypothetical protein
LEQKYPTVPPQKQQDRRLRIINEKQLLLKRGQIKIIELSLNKKMSMRDGILKIPCV